MSTSDLFYLTATQLAQLIRERQASAVEVVEAHLNRITQHNSDLNAIGTVDAEGARQRAKEADVALAKGQVWGPLHGVPVTIKDAFETAGLRTTCSYKPLANNIPQKDATVVARLRQAGAIILGKTNLPTMASGPQTNSPIFGRANNPWDVSRTPGGSTGGGAAAVAAGLSPLEVGSDLGGSIRIPAHFCGVFGFKPTEHRVPMAGHIPDMEGRIRRVRHLGVGGPLARSVEDLRLCFRLIAGPDERDSEVPPVPLNEPPQRALKEYRFAWTDSFPNLPVTSDTRAALEGLAGKLGQAGCQIARLTPAEFDFAAVEGVFSSVGGFELGPHLSAVPRLMIRMVASLTGGDWYIQGLAQRDALIMAMEHFLAEWDAWLCPVACLPAFPHCEPETPLEVDGEKVPYMKATTGYTVIFTITDNPVVILPLARSKEGLPIGVQVVGRRWQDMELLNVAKVLTEVTGGFQSPPGF